MSESKVFTITCTCDRQKKFPFRLNVEHDPEKKTSPPVQIECPFSHEDYCDKHMSITLPAGMQPAEDDSMLRE